MKHVGLTSANARTLPRTLRTFLYASTAWILVAVAALADESNIVSWNAYSLQFIDPPVFELLELPDTIRYCVVIRQAGKSWQLDAERPCLDLSPIWEEISVQKFHLTFEWRDANGKILSEESSWRTKAPDWQGVHEKPDDWVTAADRNIAYLIRAGVEGQAPYREPGVPVWMWSAASPTEPPTPEVLGPGFQLEWYRNAFQYRADRWPDGHDEGYPGCIVPAMIYAFTAHAAAERPQAQQAMALARSAANWLLEHRLPGNCKLPLFPYSTISRGKYYGGVESKNVNLLRASWIGLSLVRLYGVTQDQRYLDYARHIATVTATFQAGDGSFPYRLDPSTGEVTEAFCTGAIQFSLLVEALRPYGVSNDLLRASQRAILWTLAYPSQTNHWQAGYEDFGERKPYENLTHWETQLVIQYLCRHADEHPSYLPLAKRLNRFVEDQFVLFGPQNKSHPVPIKGPLVFEQYGCWWPMEGHAGYWIQTLIALHRATGEREYLDKAQATADAICAQQFEDGAISNWGTRWLEDGQVGGENCGHNWYNTNAIASAALYWLDDYCRDFQSQRADEADVRAVRARPSG